MADKILIITGDGGKGYETWYAYHRFQEAAYEPHIAVTVKRRLHLYTTEVNRSRAPS